MYNVPRTLGSYLEINAEDGETNLPLNRTGKGKLSALIRRRNPSKTDDCKIIITLIYFE